MDPRPLPTRLDTAVPLLFGLTKRPLLALCLGGAGAALLWFATGGDFAPRVGLAAAPPALALALALGRIDGEPPEAAAAAALRYLLRPRTRAWAPRGQDPAAWLGDGRDWPTREATLSWGDDAVGR